MDLSEDNPTLHNDILAELPGVDLETDSSDTQQVVSPAVIQSDAERVQTAIQNSVLIYGNTMGSIGVPTLVDEQPAVSHDPTALSQECINPKVEPTLQTKNPDIFPVYSKRLEYASNMSAIG